MEVAAGGALEGGWRLGGGPGLAPGPLEGKVLFSTWHTSGVGDSEAPQRWAGPWVLGEKGAGDQDFWV